MFSNPTISLAKAFFLKRGLTFRQAEIAELVCTGISNKEVGEKIFIHERSVKCHLSNIYKELCVKNRTQLVILYFKEFDLYI